MIGRRRTSHRTLWIAALFVLSAVSRNASPASGPVSASWEVDARSWYVGGARTREDSSHSASWDEWGADLKCVASPQLTKNVLLRFGAEWQRLSFGVSSRAAAPFFPFRVLDSPQAQSQSAACPIDSYQACQGAPTDRQLVLRMAAQAQVGLGDEPQDTVVQQ